MIHCILAACAAFGLLLAATETLAQERPRPPRIPTGYEVKGSACYVHDHAGTRQVNCLDVRRVFQDIARLSGGDNGTGK